MSIFRITIRRKPDAIIHAVLTCIVTLGSATVAANQRLLGNISRVSCRLFCRFLESTDCLVSADDLYTMVYIPRLLLFTDSVGLFCMLPAVVILAYVLIPLFVFFGFPYYGLKEFRELATHHGRRQVNPYLLIVIVSIFEFSYYNILANIVSSSIVHVQHTDDD